MHPEVEAVVSGRRQWTVIEGDCLSILPIPGVTCITDPPFGIAYSSGYGSDEWDDGSIEGDADTSVRDAALKLLGDAPTLSFGSWKRPRPPGTRMVLVWDTLGALGMGDLRLPWKPSHQEIYVLGNPEGFYGSRGSDVIQHPPVQSMARNGRVHPFEKPVGLMLKLIGWTVGDLILDPFCGSGSTGVAAIKMGRQFIGIEIDPDHAEVARRRISEAADHLFR